ncbi:MAG: 3-oxoacyl-ACP reductase family protein [Dehalococcoidia bacterium]|nr:3-oxoacyl-ACP reductase family protein [Dehalococcoidia bacterium]
MIDLTGKKALVTGAGRGIGRAIALGLARAGADVAVNDVRDDLAAGTVDEIAALGRLSFSAQADVSRLSQVEEMFDLLKRRWGRLDIMVNNAGVNTKSSLLTLSEKDWDYVLGVNLKGVFLCTQAAARIMVDQRYGRIISVASVSAKSYLPMASHYCASKAGIVGFNREAARELGAFGITVNAVCPGLTETELSKDVRADPEFMRRRMEETPLKRIARPEDMVGMAVFLASDAASHITGQAFNVDGGAVMY